jgi:hypothetical protein
MQTEIWSGNQKIKEGFGKPMHRRQANFKMNIKEIIWGKKKNLCVLG